MNPRSLTLQNVGRFTDLHLDFHPGCAAVVGPNGAGKSTILNSIELALFADGSRDLAGLLAPWADRLQIQLEFEHQNELYRVRRGYKQTAGGRGTATLDLERNRLNDEQDERGERPDSWIPETRETADATQQRLEQILGLSRPTFNASSFLGQGNAAAFSEAKPADRKAILGSILDPRGLWPQLAELVKADTRAAETTLQVDRARVMEREPLAAQAPEILATLNQAKASVEAEQVALGEAELFLEQAQQAEAGNQAAAERVRAAAAEHTAAGTVVTEAQARLQHATTETAKLPAAREKLAELEALTGRIPVLEQADEARRAAQLAAETARRLKAEAQAQADRQRDTVNQYLRCRVTTVEQHTAAQTRLAHLEAAEPGTEQCDRCEQILGEQARDAAIASLRAETETLVAVLADVDGVIEAEQAKLDHLDTAAAAIEIPAVPDVDVTAELAAARGAVERVATGRILIQGYEDLAGQVPALTEQLRDAAHELDAKDQALKAATAGVKDTTQLAADVHLARGVVATRRTILQDAQATVIRTQEQLDRANRAHEEIQEIQDAQATALARLDTLKLAERAYGRDGIPALIAENAVPVIETEANRILERMPTDDGVVLRLELHTQRALKSDATAVRETLDILVADPDGVRAYETFSGGERARVNIALRVSLARLLAGRRGADVQLLAIDELDHLDAVGFTGLVAVLKEMQASVEKILIVSHHPDLQLAFADRIEISKRDGVSELVGAREAEAVPA